MEVLVSNCDEVELSVWAHIWGCFGDIQQRTGSSGVFAILVTVCSYFSFVIIIANSFFFILLHANKILCYVRKTVQKVLQEKARKIFVCGLMKKYHL